MQRQPAWEHVLPMKIACAMDASHSCRSRRYSLVPLFRVATLSSPGPRAQHSSALRVVTFVGSGILGILLDGTKSPRRGGLPRPPVVAVCIFVRRLRKHLESRICQCGRAQRSAPTRRICKRTRREADHPKPTALRTAPTSQPLERPQADAASWRAADDQTHPPPSRAR